eukprot:985756-Pyramimonas_sp.AAC.1
MASAPAPVMQMIKSNTPGWEELVPAAAAEAIKKGGLFNYVNDECPAPPQQSTRTSTFSRPSRAVVLKYTYPSPGVDGQKGLRLQFDSRQSSTVDTSKPFVSAQHFEYSTEYSAYNPCPQTATTWLAGSRLRGLVPTYV